MCRSAPSRTPLRALMSHIAFPFFRSFLISFSSPPSFSVSYSIEGMGSCMGPARSIGIIFFFFLFLVSCSYSLEPLIGGLENSYLFSFFFFRLLEPNGWIPLFFHLPVFDRISGFVARIFFLNLWITFMSKFRVGS